MKLSVLVEVALFGTLVSSLAFDAPLPTAAGSHDFHPLQPAVQTMAPMDGGPELLKRDFEATVLVAPSNTCGFFSAYPTASFYCAATQDCNLFLSFYTQAATAYGAVGCCDDNDCYVYTGCVGSTAYATGARCTDTFCAYCTASTAPYCNSVTFAGVNARGGYCASTINNAFQTLVTSNALTTIHYSTDSFLVTVSSASGAASSIKSSPIVVVSSTPASSVSSAAASSTVPSPAASTTAPATSPAVTTLAQSSDSSSSTPVGAIAGGVVGGVAVLAIIGGIIFFIMRKKRRNAAQAAGTTGQAQQPPYNPNQGPPMGYAQQPPYNPNQGPPPGSQAASPQFMGAGAVAPASWEQTQNQNAYGQGYGMQNAPIQNEKTAYSQHYVAPAGPPTHDPRESIISSPGSSTYGSPLPAYVSPQTPAAAFPAPIAENLPAQLDGRNVYPHPHHDVHEISG